MQCAVHLWCPRQSLLSLYSENIGWALQTRAVALLSRAAAMCDDDTRLQRVVPYLLVRSLAQHVVLVLLLRLAIE